MNRVAQTLLALAVSIALIVGAAWFRSSRNPTSDRPTTSDPAATTGSTNAADEPMESGPIACVVDLAAVCSGLTDFDISIVDPGDTLADTSAPPSVWITIEPFPGALPTQYTSTPVASSPLVVVGFPDRIAAATTACGNPIEWQCLGKIAGTPWADQGGQASWGSVRPGLSPGSTAVGMFSEAAAVNGYFGSEPVDGSNPSFVSWGSFLARAVPANTLSSGTAIGTIQVRPSVLDLAVGAQSELTAANAERFSVAPVGAKTTNIVVTIAVSEGAKMPDGLDGAIRGSLKSAGWETGTIGTAGVDAGQLIGNTAIWSQLQ